MRNTIFPLILILFLSSCKNNSRQLSNISNEYQTKFFIELASFDSASLKSSLDIPIENEGSLENKIDFEDVNLLIQSKIEKLEEGENGYEININAKITEGRIKDFCLGFKIAIDYWSEDNYLVMPGAVYAGNRFQSIIRKRGVPIFDIIQNYEDEIPLITNVPRLEINRKESLLQLLSGDMSTPSVGIRFDSKNKGLFLLSEQDNERGDYSYSVRETKNHDSATIVIRIPGLREDTVYKGGSNPFYPSTDKGAELKKGDEINLKCKVFFFDAPDIPAVYDYFAEIRNSVGDQSLPVEIPYSAAWKIMEEKYNKQNWVPEYGYYSVGMRESTYQDWQTGWVGGMNTVYPLLVNGSDSTFSRAMKTFDFLFDTISPSGLFYEVFYDGVWQLTNTSSFLRRNSDALYFILKSFALIQRRNPDFIIPDSWIVATRNSANAFVKLWEENGEFGQWVDFNSGKNTAGGTSSNGIAPAALALCSKFFDDKNFMNVALESAEYYYRNYVLKGYTNGGPGDIYQNVDSESAFGLLESFVVLYEITRDKKWLGYAEDMANQCATWVVSYNFDFPENSTFAKMNMKTTGTVIANVQNKHAAPGICTLSGNSLLKLYRITGNKYYLELIRDIVKTIPQYMSRTDRPITDPRPGVLWPAMPSGWINERVNMSDWEERGNPGDIKRGEIFGGSTWSEPAFMNTYAELPGIYFFKDKNELSILDNIEAVLGEDNTLIITNPTKFDATVKLFIESSSERSEILRDNYFDNFKQLNIPSGKSMQYKFNQ